MWAGALAGGFTTHAFQKGAREIEADEDETRWEERLKKVAKPAAEATEIDDEEARQTDP